MSKMYEIYKVDKNDLWKVDKTPIEHIFSLNWQDNIDSNFISFNFESDAELSCDDWIVIYNKNIEEFVFWGVIKSVTQTNSKNSLKQSSAGLDESGGNVSAGKESITTNHVMYKYFGYDYGFYIEKQLPQAIQYNDEKVNNAILQFRQKGNLNVGNVMIKENITIDKIYNEKDTFSQIIKEIMNLQIDDDTKIKDKYHVDCRNGSINIYEFLEVEDIKGYIANKYELDSFKHILSYTKNITTDAIKENFIYLKMTVYADSRLHKGIILNIANKHIGIYGKYLVTKTTHDITGSVEKVEVILKRLIPKPNSIQNQIIQSVITNNDQYL